MNLKKRSHLLSLLVLGAVTLLSSCSMEQNPFYEGKVFVGDKYASAKVLNKGKHIYTEYCMACHGVDGSGNGVAAKGLFPAPRNLKLGIYKFGNVVSGELPHDKDFYRILKNGLHGTAMFPWDMGEGQLEAVTQYIKTFAPQVWEDKNRKLGEYIVPTKDPFGLAHRSAAIEKGKEVYHAVAQCQSCHRAYVSKTEMGSIYQKVNGETLDLASLGEDLYQVKLQPSEHGVNGLPPDFTWHEIRSAKTEEELYVRLVAGVGGSSMPSWKDTLSDDQIWAVSYYVKSLMDLKGKPMVREELLKSMEGPLEAATVETPSTTQKKTEGSVSSL
jgi:mono/diheme cytochrome c family protein